MLSAFSGNPEVRAATLQGLAARLEAKQLTTGALFWNGTTGSLTGAMIESSSAQHWQEQLGLAKWVAYALDAVTNGLPPADVVAIGSSLLGAITPGSDTTLLGSRIVVIVLSRLPLPIPGALQEARREVRLAHERTLSGQSLSSLEWKNIRKRATAATDACEDSDGKALGACIEAAGWDPVTSHTTVADVLRLWIAFEGTKVDVELGWTEQDNQRTRRLLSEMYATYIQDKPDENRDVFMLLEAHHPAEEARLRQYTQDKRAAEQQCSARAAALLIETLGGTSL